MPGKGKGISKYLNRNLTGVSPAFSFGTVTQYLSRIQGNEFIDDSGNGYNVDIINNDIALTSGFPYKSGAMIAQKVGNFGLIPDPTNFWFTGGVPNQIPVVSFFQNIDYANQIFCRHISQVLDGDGVEVYEPRVLEIVTYSSVLSGSNLINANSYFSTTALDASYVNVPGDYVNNTLAIAAVTAGTTVYNKTGVKTEPAQLVINKALPVKGVGYSINNYTGAPANLVTMSAISSIQRVVLNGNSTIAIGFRLFSNTCLIDKIKMFELGASNGFFQEAGTSAIIRNSVFVQSTNKNYFLQSAPNVLVDGCYISGVFSFGMFGANSVNTETQTVQYCKIFTTTGINANAPFLVFNFNYNNLTISNVDRIIRMTTANCILNFKYNRIQGTGTSGANSGVIVNDLPLTGSFNIEYNYYRTSDGIGAFILVPTSKDSIVRGNNVRLLSCSLFYDSIANSAIIEMNRFVTYGTGSSANISAISISTTGATKRNIVIQKNTILNPKYFNTALGGYHNCIYIRDYIDTVCKYNYVAGAGIANIIVKSTTGMDNTECPVIYNVSYQNGILAKGQGYVKIYNNTVVDSLGQYGIGMVSADDSSVLKTTYAKNNIVVNAINSIPLIEISNEDPLFRHVLDYNVYYSTDPMPFKYLGVSKTFAQWQALGYDLNSIMLTTQQFNNLFEDYSNRNFKTKTSYLIGENLGAAYSVGLDKSTNWGSDTEIPNVVTKSQPANWNVGAYIL